MRRILLAAIILLAVPASSVGRSPSVNPPITIWHPVPRPPAPAIPSAVIPHRETDPERATPAPKRPPRVSGVPTWYCEAGVSRCTAGHPDRASPDFYAAAGPSLRIGNWRGRIVTVCARWCIRVQLIDWCACSAPHFIDLYHDAWEALGGPSWATVNW